MSIEIALLSKEHSAAAIKLFYHSYRELDDEPLTSALKKQFISFFKKDITDKKNICWIVLSNGKAVGFLRGKLRRRVAGEPLSRAFLEDVYLLPRFRNSGIGKKLVRLFHEWAKKKKMRTIELNAHKNAVYFWKKLGFVETHRIMHKRI